MALPTLDFSQFLHGAPEARQELAEALVNSFKKFGFVKLINHGLPEQTVRDYLTGAKQLFHMPLEKKHGIENVKGPQPQRGWSSKGAEQTSRLWKDNFKGREGQDLVDEREFFDAGPPDDEEYVNKWPADEDCPGFKSTMEQCYGLLQQVCLCIMEAMEVGLHLPNRALVDRCIPASSEIRLNYYPQTSLKILNNGTVKRTWPHTDFGIITLLFQDHVGGLELQDRENPSQFLPVAPSPPGLQGKSEMVVNISDTFQRWTNGHVRAGLHQVAVPSAMKGLTEGFCPERHSAIFFFKAHRNVSVGPLPYFVTDDSPAAYDEISALEFQKRMTKALY